MPLRRIDPPDTRSHPQGGVQIYPKVKFTMQNHEKKSYASPAPIFTKFTHKIKIIIQSIIVFNRFLVDDDLRQIIGKIR